MSKRHPKNAKARPSETMARPSSKAWWLAAIAVLAIAGVLLAMRRTGSAPEPVAGATVSGSTNAKPATASTPVRSGEATNAIPTMEAAQSVVVTHDLDYGAQRPRLSEILRDIERRHQADDGLGRTFAILEAFNGEVQPDGKIRVSLRVSTEKPGAGEIVFRRTGQSLWKNRITAATQKPAFTGGSLTILFDDGNGKSFTVDGSTNPQSIFGAVLKELGQLVAQAWPEGEVRELSFIYSSCGCPVKVSCRRMGERAVRTKEQSQVIFPDDAPVVQVINRLMAW